MVDLYEYSIFGEVSASDPNHPNRFLFTGRELDKDTGLYYYRARYYNPYIGRFLQTDPAREGMNTYAYCGNDPIGLIDPSGHEGECPWWTFSFSFSTKVIQDEPMGAEQAFELVSKFFNDWLHFDEDYPAWRISDVQLSVKDDKQSVAVTWSSAWYTWEQASPTVPAMNEWSAHVEGESVPFLVVDGIGMLTDRVPLTR